MKPGTLFMPVFDATAGWAKLLPETRDEDLLRKQVSG